MSIILIYGMPGMGKTTWMHDYIKAQPQQRFFVMDHAEEWGEDAPHWRGKPPPLTIFERGDGIPAAGGFPDFGVFIFRGMEFFDVADLCLREGNTVYVDDEIDLAARKQGWDDNPIRTMVHQGRHAENHAGEFTQVHVLGACRRPQSLHTDITDLAEQVCIFRVQGTRTLGRLESDSMLEEGEWDTIRTLPKFQFRHWPSGEYREVQPIGGDDGRHGTLNDSNNGANKVGKSKGPRDSSDAGDVDG